MYIVHKALKKLLSCVKFFTANINGYTFCKYLGFPDGISTLLGGTLNFILNWSSGLVWNKNQARVMTASIK